MRHLWLIFAVFGVTACGDNREFPPIEDRYDGAGVLPALTEGDWYRPTAATTWQWQLTGTINTSYDVEVYDVDLFEAPAATIAALQADGRHVVCYLSGGSYEDWRPDAGEFADVDIGRKLDGWAGERWLDIRSDEVFAILERRFDLAVEKGCDGVEPDNVDSYTNSTGFALEEADQTAFNKALSHAAHTRGLSIGLKNSGDRATELEPYFDFELNEQCHEYDECNQLDVFIRNDKPVWNAEYPRKSNASAGQELADEVCSSARASNYRTLVLPLDLDDSFRVSCD